MFEENHANLYAHLDALHNVAKQNSSNEYQGYKLLLNYLRSGTYTGSSWNEVAGTLDNSFISLIDTQYNYLSYLKTSKPLYSFAPGYGGVDFTHLSATANALLYESKSIQAIVVGDDVVNDLSGWAGDLQTLIIDAIQKTNNSSNYSTFYNAVFTMMGSEEYSFDMDDLLADLDAIYLMDNKSYTKTFGQQVKEYYETKDKSFRFNYFINKFSEYGGQYSETFLYNRVYRYTKNISTVPLVQWPLYKNYGVTVTSTQSEAARDAFIAYIYQYR